MDRNKNKRNKYNDEEFERG